VKEKNIESINFYLLKHISKNITKNYIKSVIVFASTKKEYENKYCSAAENLLTLMLPPLKNYC